MKKYNTKAVVLKNINYQDSHRIYTLFTLDYGKISAIARGVRKISSRRSGNLDTLNYIDVKITENSKGFRNIDEVKTINSFKNIKSSYELSTKAYYVAELLYRSLEEDQDAQDIFKLFVKVLTFLDRNGIISEVLVAYFELNLLKFLGYKLPEEAKVFALKDLEKGRVKEITLEDVKKVDPIIKSYIHQHLGENFKSLEII